MSAAQDARALATVKGLIMDATRAANSGHPGGAMSSADFVYLVYSEFMNFDPTDAGYFNRDRFVLSAGHESALQYALLHLWDVLSVEDLQGFRQYGSRTPGHPENTVTPFVEATTGPLGQGISMAAGMAAAEAHLRATLGADLCDHYTYVLASDGDMQEPVSLGTASLAGLWKLGRLIAFYDSNKIQIGGCTDRCDCTDYAAVYKGLGWQVIEVDGHDMDAIRAALKAGKAEEQRPTLIIGHTVMARGCHSVEGSHKTHGSPLTPEEIAATKECLGLDPLVTFAVDDDVRSHVQRRRDEMIGAATVWKTRLAARLEDPDFAKRWALVEKAGAGDAELAKALPWPTFTPGESMATRKSWGACLDAITEALPTLVGGSADLDPSNMTVNFRESTGDFGCTNFAGRNLPFGVREFPMSAVMNGIALHGGLVAYGATFLTFSDYCRNGMRMSALQELPVLYVYTHDSFHVGEDGPTHQPIEHVASLRLIPNLLVLRPADATETIGCLRLALSQASTPSALCLTRQGLPVLDDAATGSIEGSMRGGYVVDDCEGEPEAVIVASGSEVSLAMAAKQEAALSGKRIRVVSMPCMEVFDAQDEGYRTSVIPPSCAHIFGVEAGRPESMLKYATNITHVKGLDHFGHSAPAGRLAEEYGFVPQAFASFVAERLG